jgi:20S proteasome subunit beta 1
VAIPYNQGVVVGADSRTSVSGYVSHREAQKIVPLTSHLCVLRSGSAADTQYLVHQVRQIITERLYRYGWTLSIPHVAGLLQSIVYENNNGGDMQASLIIAGYDKETGKPHVYSMAQSGALLEEVGFGLSGSGSTYIYGFLDHALSKSDAYERTRDEAVQLCRQALQLAIDRDGSSGGPIRIMVIDKDGYRAVSDDRAISSASENEETASESLASMKPRSVHLSGFADPARRSN